MPNSDFTGQMLFQPPEPITGASDIVQTALLFAAISERLAAEDRTHVIHRGGRAENVAEHSFMLSLVAPVLAEQYHPELNSGLVSRFATIHDIVEAYVGDTPTHDIDEAGLETKAQREERGLRQLVRDFAAYPLFTKLVEDYEKQDIPEARFVRVVDKLMPLLIHFNDGGAELRQYIDAKGLRQNSAERAASLRQEYPEFERLIAAREELAELAASHLFLQ